MPKTSAGLVLFRRPEGRETEVFLIHPGGPLYTKKDKEWWSIPKGLPDEGEPLEVAARREFGEETGYEPKGEIFPLGQIRQKGGKVVHAWALEGDMPQDWVLNSNTFRQEWPPRSGQWQTYPEVDQARFFSISEAREYILPSQQPLLDRLVEVISDSGFVIRDSKAGHPE